MSIYGDKTPSHSPEGSIATYSDKISRPLKVCWILDLSGSITVVPCKPGDRGSQVISGGLAPLAHSDPPVVIPLVLKNRSGMDIHCS